MVAPGYFRDCGCNSRSLQDGWEMTRWLAPTSSKDFGCNSRSPRDCSEMAGWLAFGISKDFRCHFLIVGRSLGDGWGMAGRAPVVFEHPIQINFHQYSKKPCSANKNQTRWLGGWRRLVQEHFGCKSKSLVDGPEMAGRRVGGCRWLFPKIAGVTLDRCKMAGG